ncbi:peptidoglycan DD-metalloendopeptidase family protein [Stenotrophomonas sp. CD2]|nr:peptidoglycan DD-metalloendopeptidase family protein [Stenotrophomonas sp. CD2]
MAQLRLQPLGEHWQARVDNALAGPLQVELRAAPGRPVEGLPVQSLIQGDSSLVVGHLPAPSNGRTLDLRLQSVPGNPAAQAEDVAYRLPFDTTRPRVDQAPQGRFSHDDEENRDAVDFALPEGTLVLAAREGTVMQIQDGFRGNGQDRERDGARANFIRVLHSDGSMALYGHLQAGGMRVRRGRQWAPGSRSACPATAATAARRTCTSWCRSTAAWACARYRCASLQSRASCSSPARARPTAVPGADRPWPV